mmetsp:Transcript_7708/g.10890  ORF Transcript_7708/g.10890 Transcript_7708/m.10890 type:complete len:89 (-) Transcript_7708:762-1028(-)
MLVDRGSFLRGINLVKHATTATRKIFHGIQLFFVYLLHEVVYLACFGGRPHLLHRHGKLTRLLIGCWAADTSTIIVLFELFRDLGQLI